MERVEATFIKHFSNSNPRKGMKILRQKLREKSIDILLRTLGQVFATICIFIYLKFMKHFNLIFPDALSLILFTGKFSGFFAGCAVSLLVSLVLIIHIGISYYLNLSKKERDTCKTCSLEAYHHHRSLSLLLLLHSQTLMNPLYFLCSLSSILNILILCALFFVLVTLNILPFPQFRSRFVST